LVRFITLFDMKITRSNYESWFLDFLDGNIDPLMENDFLAFLIQNPDLAEELEIVDIMTLVTDTSIQFTSKEQLKKLAAGRDNAFNDRAVAYHEGDLELTERTDFETWLGQNAGKAAEAELFGKLKLVSDKSIIYRNKLELKRRASIIPMGKSGFSSSNSSARLHYSA
jgi:hypothetical protein